WTGAKEIQPPGRRVLGPFRGLAHLPRLRGAPPARRSPGRAHYRPFDHRPLEAHGERSAKILCRVASHAFASKGRRQDPRGNSQPPPVPRRSRPGLSHARPPHLHTLGRRVTTHPTRDLSRLASGWGLV